MSSPFGSPSRGAMTTSSEIVATGFGYPSARVDNAAYFSQCQFPITTDPDALIRETEMKSRHWCAPGENTWTMARDAVRMTLGEDPRLREEIDLVIVASGTTMPVLYPPERENAGVADLAPLIVRELGRPGILGLDIKACYCTGFLRGLQVADAMLVNTNYRSALVVASEQGSPFAVAKTNRSSFCFIMSDAAGAVVLRRTPVGRVRGIIDYVGSTEADKLDWVGIGPDGASMIMRGSRAATATHEMLVRCGRTLLARNGLTHRDVDWLIPIQTHAGVIEGMRNTLEWPKEKLLWFGDVTGFAGSASIPACLSEHLRKGVVKKGDLVLSLAVGAGMNSAGALYYV